MGLGSCLRSSLSCNERYDRLMSDQKDISKVNARITRSVLSASATASPTAPASPTVTTTATRHNWVASSVRAGVRFGVSGTTALRCGGPYSREAAYAEALAWQPQVVVIALGTNDTKPKTGATRRLRP